MDGLLVIKSFSLFLSLTLKISGTVSGCLSEHSIVNVLSVCVLLITIHCYCCVRSLPEHLYMAEYANSCWNTLAAVRRNLLSIPLDRQRWLAGIEQTEHTHSNHNPLVNRFLSSLYRRCIVEPNTHTRFIRTAEHRQNLRPSTRLVILHHRSNLIWIQFKLKSSSSLWHDL